MEVQICYQDNDFIVAYKPYGVLSEESDSKPNMPAMLRELTGCGEVYTVHRLDRTTQGLMVYAKTPGAAKRLGDIFQRGEAEKRYLAVVQGVPEPGSGELSDLLYFDRRKNKSYVVSRERRGVKKARLSYDTLATIQNDGVDITLLSVRLHTGRTHQIRVQFASRRMPLAGDRRYGSSIKCEQIMLCSAKLSFKHPFTGEELSFSYEPTNELFGLFNIKA